jgi:hypothetical protein
MSIRSVIAVLIAGALCLGGSCCKKDELLEPPVQHLPQELKDWMYFKQNTWWLYQDSASLIMDSVTVDSSRIDIIDFTDPKSGDIQKRVERFSVFTFSNLNSYLYLYSTGLRCMDRYDPNRVCYDVFRDRYYQNSHAGMTIAFLFSPIIGSQVAPNGLTAVTLSAIYDSISIGNKYYYNIVKIEETKNETEDNSQTVFYISKNFGIIRKEITTGNSVQIWNLIDYNIIQ